MSPTRPNSAKNGKRNSFALWVAGKTGDYHVSTFLDEIEAARNKLNYGNMLIRRPMSQYLVRISKFVRNSTSSPTILPKLEAGFRESGRHLRCLNWMKSFLQYSVNPL